MLPIYSFVYLTKFIGKINTNKLNIDKLKSWFKKEQIFNNGDLFDFYKILEPQIKETTVNWRIYSLSQMGILNRIGRGKYILGEARKFIPEVPDKIKIINNKLQSLLLSCYPVFCILFIYIRHTTYVIRVLLYIVLKFVQNQALSEKISITRRSLFGHRGTEATEK